MTDPKATGLAPVAPKKKPKAQLSRELGNHDASSLEFYFCDGKSMFARSTTGSMLERADLFSRRSVRCWGCPDEPGIASDGTWCKGCAGTGYIPVDISYSNPIHCAPRNKRAACTCHPERPVNAHPTAESTEGGGYEPSHEVLQLYGRVSRRLGIVAVYGGRTLVDALDDYYGTTGAKWGRRREGRLFGLYPRTLAGRRLILKDCEKDNFIALAPDERIRNLNDAQQRQPKKWRGDLLEQAAVQARRLYGDACAAFNFSAMLVRASPAEAIARALRAAARVPDPVALPVKRHRQKFDPEGVRPASEIFGKGKDGFAKMRRLAEEEQAAQEAAELERETLERQAREARA